MKSTIETGLDRTESSDQSQTVVDLIGIQLGELEPDRVVAGAADFQLSRVHMTIGSYRRLITELHRDLTGNGEAPDFSSSAGTWAARAFLHDLDERIVKPARRRDNITVYLKARLEDLTGLVTILRTAPGVESVISVREEQPTEDRPQPRIFLGYYKSEA